MDLVICGEASYQEAKSSFLMDFRPPFLPSSQIAEQMDRAEYLSYLYVLPALVCTSCDVIAHGHRHHTQTPHTDRTDITHRHFVSPFVCMNLRSGGPPPLRLRFVPVPRGTYHGYAIIVDLNVSSEFTKSTELLERYDTLGYRVIPRTMYEHFRAVDSEGHMSCGFMCIILAMLRELWLGLRGGVGLELFFVFKQLVLSDLTLANVIDINLQSFRELCERHILQNGGDRSVEKLLGSLKTYPLSPAAEMPGTMHGVISHAVAYVLIEDTMRCARYGLHSAIVRCVGGALSDQVHHYATFWYVDANSCVS